MTPNPESQAREDARRKAAADWLQRLDDLPFGSGPAAWLHWHGESEQNRKASRKCRHCTGSCAICRGITGRELRRRFEHTDPFAPTAVAETVGSGCDGFAGSRCRGWGLVLQVLRSFHGCLRRPAGPAPHDQARRRFSLVLPRIPSPW